jgi:hypothetical protein
MTLLGKIFLVSIISTIALIGSLGSSNPWPGFIVAWVAWGLFIWSILPKRKSRREGERERLIAEILKKIDR